MRTAPAIRLSADNILRNKDMIDADDADDKSPYILDP